MQTRCAGFSMMEVLVAMLVIGTGALALVMLQLHALRSSTEGARHASATLLAQELADLRAATPSTPGAADPFLFSFTAGKATRPSAQADCDLTPCAPGTFASAAVSDWIARLTQELLEARATVCRDAHSTPQERWTCEETATAPVVLKLGWRRSAVAATAAPARAPLLTLVLGR